MNTEANEYHEDLQEIEDVQDESALDEVDVSSNEETPVESDPQSSSYAVSTIDQQRAEEQAAKAREALAKFHEVQPYAADDQGEGTAPDPGQDIIGYIKWMGDKLQEQDAFIRAQQQAHQQAFEQQQYHGHLNQFLESSVKAIQGKYSDFDAAADFLYNTRATQLSAWSTIYPAYAHRETIDGIIGDELRTVVANCAEKGVNPAEEIYRLAQNLGYQAKGVQANHQLAALENRQNSSKTLTASGGTGSGGSMTKETIANMSEREFNAWISNPKNEAVFNELMGVGTD
ncbi:hypothetical protein [Bartonella rattaustraliani]|uniref:hypothetical protein n=1 Tax=Bartonella rattaustraliani TaxID=481139 RepID=UPI00031BA146|nr:hypothetical protein [Bartonella rattaustraliani]